MHFPPAQSFVHAQLAPKQPHDEPAHTPTVTHVSVRGQPVFTQPAGFGSVQPADEHVLP